MALPAKREDKLPLERALRALEDLHKSLKEFSKTDSVMGNAGLRAEAENVRAKAKKLQPADWEGSTFTISNLGMFGIDQFTAIINPPDACILAVGGIKETPIVKDGQLVAGHTMKVTLSCDHRVVDGATGSAFLQTFKYLMENPVLLLGMQNI